MARERCQNVVIGSGEGGKYLDTGHFAFETHGDIIVATIRDFFAETF